MFFGRFPRLSGWFHGQYICPTPCCRDAGLFIHSVRVCVCVCEKERERESERASERERERERESERASERVCARRALCVEVGVPACVSMSTLLRPSQGKWTVDPGTYPTR